MTALKVVPVEPIDEMKIAAIKFHRGWLGDYFSFDYWAGVYKAMLSAVEPAPDGLVEPVAWRTRINNLLSQCVESSIEENRIAAANTIGELLDAAALTSRAAVLEEAAKNELADADIDQIIRDVKNEYFEDCERRGCQPSKGEAIDAIAFKAVRDALDAAIRAAKGK